MEIGKIENQLLKKIIFDKITCRREEILVHAGVGEDCAVIDFGEYDCIISTDPITGAVNEIGRLAIHVSCNDIAASGVEPLGIMLAVLLPVGTTEEQLGAMMTQAAEEAAKLNVEIIGGHTEITPVVNTPVIISTAVGRGLKSKGKQEKIKPGDYIYMTKTAGLEGTGIIASDCSIHLDGVLTENELKEARNMFEQISVVKEGIAAGKIGVSAMHDITEGGVLGAVWELCQTADCGGEIYADDIPVAEVTRKICNHFGIDVLRLISSGCMLIIADPGKDRELSSAMKELHIPFQKIGSVKGIGEELSLVTKIKVQGQPDKYIVEPITPPASDELYKVIHQ